MRYRGGVTYLDENKEVNVKGEQGPRHVLRGLREQPRDDGKNYFKAYGCHPQRRCTNIGDGIVLCREGRCINVAHARHRRILAPRRVTSMERLHLEPEMIDSGYGIFGWNERPAIHSPSAPAVSYGNNTRGVGLKSSTAIGMATTRAAASG